MGRIRYALLTAAALSFFGCAAFTGEVGEPNYANDADTNLKRGNDALESKNFQEAEKYFEHVRTKYPFLEAARIAELRLADTLFEKDQFAEARDAYQNFVKLHPTHPKVDYAAFRAAYTYYKELPSEFFALPPAYEKDPTDARGVVKAMGDFIRQYPNSSNIPEAKKAVDTARRLLARHEMYVAHFYKKRLHWAGAAGRYENVVKDYLGLGFDEEALFGLYEAYVHLQQPEKAKATLKKLEEVLPDSHAAERARKMLGS